MKVAWDLALQPKLQTSVIALDLAVSISDEEFGEFFFWLKSSYQNFF